ncbi:MAG: hypothetical protein C5B58_09450 [Acidobacteria bacterium]|nr:MAG: hypothetical protein C5B58_09450 [Acidobacteriota bacterium]
MRTDSCWENRGALIPHPPKSRKVFPEPAPTNHRVVGIGRAWDFLLKEPDVNGWGGRMDALQTHPNLRPGIFGCQEPIARGANAGRGSLVLLHMDLRDLAT